MSWINRLKELREERAEALGEIPKALIVEVSKVSKAPLPVSATADNHPSGWQGPMAWLEGDELRVQGVFDGDWPDGGLTPEIIRLTSGNLPLQKQLLRLHVGRYHGPWWNRLVEVWQEKIAELIAEGKAPTKETELKAAQVLKAVAFLDELRGGCSQ
jgi:hypothetical protein